MNITPGFAAVFGGIGGAAISGLFMVYGQWLTRRSEERRHMLDLCFSTAMQNWERDTEMAKWRSTNTGQGTAVSPLDLYIIHMFSLMKLSGHSQEQMLKEWSIITKRTCAAFETAKEQQRN